MLSRRYRQLWANAVLAAALGVALFATPPAHAGLLDFLFGGPDRGPAPPQPPSYAEPSPGLGPIVPAPLPPQSVRQGDASTGHAVAFCVRLCDGQHFPLEHMSNATPVETCRAMCPASRTKVFFGSEIGSAIASDGVHYASLDNAFVYRKQLVANCTCNGKDAFGLAPFDLSSDPTLRPGDIISTKDGLMAFNGKSGKAEAFTPVKESSVARQLNSVTHAAPGKGKEEPEAVADDDPGTIAPQTAPQPR